MVHPSKSDIYVFRIELPIVIENINLELVV